MLSNDFYALVLITLVTIVTPGPDFVIVVKNTVGVSRRAGLLTAFGVSTAIWVHIFYSIAAVSFIATQSDFIFEVIQILGAIYLFWLGWKSLSSFDMEARLEAPSSKCSAYWKQGFINNLLNPKATLFFISIFSQVIAPNTPFYLQIGYGFIITSICLSWFCLVTLMLTIRSMEPYVEKIVRPIEKIAGIIFITYAVKIFYDTSFFKLDILNI
tara:strand:+ start:957 stop:1595 length:639 start_codon:yes stop_codon:yes gene_type:complete